MFEAVALMPASTVQVAEELGFRNCSDCIGILSFLAEESVADGIFVLGGGSDSLFSCYCSHTSWLICFV